MGVLYSTGSQAGQFYSPGDKWPYLEIFLMIAASQLGVGATSFQYVETRDALNVLQSTNQPLPCPIKGFSGPECQFGYS